MRLTRWAMFALVATLIVALAVPSSVGATDPTAAEPAVPSVAEVLQQRSDEAGGGDLTGGVLADATEHPYHVAVNALFDGVRYHACSGTRVHRRFVVTAASCIWFDTNGGQPGSGPSLYRLQPSQLEVRVGASRWYTGGSVAAVKGIWLEPGYYPSINATLWPIANWDLAVLEIEPVEGARLPLLAPAQPDPFVAGRSGTLVGWGATSATGDLERSLRRTTVRLLGDASCDAAYGGILDVRTAACASNGTPGSLCYGDLGVGLVVSDESGDRLVGPGVGGGRCVDGRPMVFNDVRASWSWLRGAVPLSDRFESPDLVRPGTTNLAVNGANAQAGEPVANPTDATVWAVCIAGASGTYSISWEEHGRVTVFTGSSVDALTQQLEVTGTNSWPVARGEIYRIQLRDRPVAPGVQQRVMFQTTAPCRAPSHDDVFVTHQFFDPIERLTVAGILDGYADGGFHPSALVTRQAMAAFLYRAVGAPAGPFPDPGFPDVPPGAHFAEEIAWLAGAGIATGYSDGDFHSLGPVSRQAMAAFLYRAAGSPPGPFPAPGFDDVDPLVSEFAIEIAWLVDVGIATGYDDGGFHPGAAVSRQAMASFIQRAVTEGVLVGAG